jgi:hypothetical protein
MPRQQHKKKAEAERIKAVQNRFCDEMNRLVELRQEIVLV